MSGLVLNPISAVLGDGTQQTNNVFGKQGEQLGADMHGKWYNAAMRKGAFKFFVTAVTVPVVASGLVSVFTLWNPPASGVLAEIIYTGVGQVLATTVVDDIGWYSSSAALTAAGTFTTPAVANTNWLSARVQDTPAGQVKPYLAYTHSGTPVKADHVGTFGAVTDAQVFSLIKFHEGSLILPPGIAMSLAMSTAAGTTSGLSAEVEWAEWPFS